MELKYPCALNALHVITSTLTCPGSSNTSARISLRKISLSSPSLMFAPPAWALPAVKGEKRKGESGGGSSVDGKLAKVTDDSRTEIDTIIKKGGEKSSIIQKLVAVLAALSLATAQGLRDVTGSIFITVLMGESELPAKAMAEAGAKYAEQVKEKGKNHNLGPPYLYVWMALVESLGNAGTTTPEDKVTLGNHWKNEILAAKELTEIADTIRYCRIKKAFKDKSAKTQMMKISVRVTDTKMETAIIRSLCNMGAERKFGCAPRSGLERDAQKLLDALRK